MLMEGTQHKWLSASSSSIAQRAILTESIKRRKHRPALNSGYKLVEVWHGQRVLACCQSSHLRGRGNAFRPFSACQILHMASWSYRNRNYRLKSFIGIITCVIQLTACSLSSVKHK